MVEALMYFGLGFLVATLIALVFISLVHNRAVRLTARRLETAMPQSITETQAAKDQLRAEHAISNCRLEFRIEQLRAQTTSQLAEIARKGRAISQLKSELVEKASSILALEARENMLRNRLDALEGELAAGRRAA